LPFSISFLYCCGEHINDWFNVPQQLIYDFIYFFSFFKR